MNFTASRFALSLALGTSLVQGASSPVAWADQVGGLPLLSAQYCEVIGARRVVEDLERWADQRTELAQVQAESVRDFEKLLGRAEIVATTSSAFAAVGALGLALIPGVAAYVLPLGAGTGTGLVVSAVAVPVVYHGTNYLMHSAPQRDSGVNGLQASLQARLGDAHDSEQVQALLAEAGRLPQRLAVRFAEVRRHAGNDFERYLNSIRDPKTGEILSRWYTFGHDDRRYVAALAAEAKTNWEISKLEAATSRALAAQLAQECGVSNAR